MGFCENCPRKGEQRAWRQDDPAGKAVGTRGPLGASIVLITPNPSKADLSRGETLSGGLGGLVSAALEAADYHLTDTHIINRINCFPKGKGKKGRTPDPSKDQLAACAHRFDQDVEAACHTHNNPVLVPLGSVALAACYEFPKHCGKAVSAWRGYVLDSRYRTREGREVYAVPTLDLETIRMLALKPYPWLQKDIEVAVQVARDGGTRLYTAPESVQLPDPSMLGPESLLGFDIETKMDTGAITDIGLATLDAASSKEWK